MCHGKYFMKFSVKMKLENAPLSVNLAIEEVSDSVLYIKLMELGFSNNSIFQLVRRAPFNGPFTIKNHKSQIILRKEDTTFITVSELA